MPGGSDSGKTAGITLAIGADLVTVPRRGRLLDPARLDLMPRMRGGKDLAAATFVLDYPLAGCQHDEYHCLYFSKEAFSRPLLLVERCQYFSVQIFLRCFQMPGQQEMLSWTSGQWTRIRQLQGKCIYDLSFGRCL